MRFGGRRSASKRITQTIDSVPNADPDLLEPVQYRAIYR